MDECFDREGDFQEAAMELVRVKLPDALSFHVPNEGRHTPAYRAKMKRQGVLAGVPDIIIMYRGEVRLIELKSRRGTLSKTQKDVKWCAEKNKIEWNLCKTLSCVEAICDQLIELVGLYDKIEPRQVG